MKSKKTIGTRAAAVWAACLMLALTLAALSGCMSLLSGIGGGGKGNPGEQNSGNPDNIGTLAQCRIELSGVKSLALVNKADKKNYLIAYDAGGHSFDVAFIKESASGDTVVRQQDLSGRISNLRVTKAFTYLCFEHDEDDELSEDFYSNSFEHSFAMDNSTGKIYSLESVPYVRNMVENVVRSGGTWYVLSIENGALKAAPLVANSNIYVDDVDVDRFGNIFVGNSTTAEKSGNLILYKYVSGETYALGDDGYMYVIKSS